MSPLSTVQLQLDQLPVLIRSNSKDYNYAVHGFSLAGGYYLFNHLRFDVTYHDYQEGPMSCKEDWNDVVEEFLVHVGEEWNILVVSIDLPGQDILVRSLRSKSHRTRQNTLSRLWPSRLAIDCHTITIQIKSTPLQAILGKSSRVGTFANIFHSTDRCNKQLRRAVFTGDRSDNKRRKT